MQWYMIRSILLLSLLLKGILLFFESIWICCAPGATRCYETSIVIDAECWERLYCLFTMLYWFICSIAESRRVCMSRSHWIRASSASLSSPSSRLNSSSLSDASPADSIDGIAGGGIATTTRDCLHKTDKRQSQQLCQQQYNYTRPSTYNSNNNYSNSTLYSNTTT